MQADRIPEIHNWPEYGDEPYRTDEPSTFHIGQCYENTPAVDLICKACGSREFNVAQGSYFTALRCPKCAWEVCIHNG